MTPQFGDSRLPERFWSKCKRTIENDCWTWIGASDRYGRFGVNGHNRFAHRIAFVALVGDVPNGLDLDHLCRNRLCVNPAHLEPVSHHENIMRGNAPAARQARQTHCRNGHELSGENIYTHTRKNGRSYRKCRVCHLSKGKG